MQETPRNKFLFMALERPFIQSNIERLLSQILKIRHMILPSLLQLHHTHHVTPNKLEVIKFVSGLEIGTKQSQVMKTE